MALADLRALFESIDSDGDGKLDQQELTAYFFSLFGRPEFPLPLGCVAKRGGDTC